MFAATQSRVRASGRVEPMAAAEALQLQKMELGGVQLSATELRHVQHEIAALYPSPGLLGSLRWAVRELWAQWHDRPVSRAVQCNPKSSASQVRAAAQSVACPVTRVRRHIAPRARDLTLAEHNVHGLGRDANVRQGLQQLLEADSDFNVYAARAHILGFISSIAEDDSAFGRRLHPTGHPLHVEARYRWLNSIPSRMLAPEWQPLSSPSATMMVWDAASGHNADGVSAERCSAAIWRLILRMQAPDGSPTSTRKLVRQLQEDFVAATAHSVDEHGHRICVGGTLQRQMLVVQNYALPDGMPPIEIERYDAVLSVNQFVSQEIEALRGRTVSMQAAAEVRVARQSFASPAEKALAAHQVYTAALRSAFDAVYRRGQENYDGVQLIELVSQLTVVAECFDLKWPPSSFVESI
jgi:hypothetical protein